LKNAHRPVEAIKIAEVNAAPLDIAVLPIYARQVEKLLGTIAIRTANARVISAP